MRQIRSVVSAGALAGLFYFACSEGHSQPPAAASDLKIVKYTELADLIVKNKGKVILLDFWADTCLPCKKAFPHLIDMHKTYEPKGLVVISVCTDELEDDTRVQTIAKARKFLESKGATCINVLIDEPTTVLKDKLRISSLPCVYVFNREGKWRQFIGADLQAADNPYGNVEEYVKQALKGPATPHPYPSPRRGEG
jgi:thiol-disulfide isomerase/thioredoxin